MTFEKMVAFNCMLQPGLQKKSTLSKISELSPYIIFPRHVIAGMPTQYLFPPREFNKHANTVHCLSSFILDNA